MQINLNKVYDYRDINWGTAQGGNSSNGILLKAVSSNGTYLKLGSYSKPYGFYGIEPIMELINSRFGELLGLNALQYGLCRAMIRLDGTVGETLICTSQDFKPPHCQSIAFDKYYTTQALSGETPLDLLTRKGLRASVDSMFLYDYLICNMDRHGKNVELLISKQGIKMAPLFDNSLTYALLRPANELAAKVPYNDTLRVSNYIGEPYLLQNLQSISAPVRIRKPTKEWRIELFQGLGKVTTRDFRDYIWDLYMRRLSNARVFTIQFTL